MRNCEADGKWAPDFRPRAATFTPSGGTALSTVGKGAYDFFDDSTSTTTANYYGYISIPGKRYVRFPEKLVLTAAYATGAGTTEYVYTDVWYPRPWRVLRAQTNPSQVFSQSHLRPIFSISTHLPM